MLPKGLLLISAINACLGQSINSPSIDWIERSENGAYRFGYATGDEGKHYHVQTASADNTVAGKFGYKDPETGGDLQTTYTAGKRGFRARGPHIARRMDLSQNKPPFSRPDDDGKYHPELDNVFDPTEDRGYDFAYRTADQIKEEHANSIGDVQGRYSYLDDVGNKHNVEYIAGSRTGFQVTNPVPDTFAQAGGGPLYFVGKGPGNKARGFHAIQKGGDGSYRFVASGPDQKRSEVSDAIGNRRGTYTYLDDKGIQHTVEYIAGPKIGYQVINNRKGTNYNPIFPFYPDLSTLNPELTPSVISSTPLPSELPGISTGVTGIVTSISSTPRPTGGPVGGGGGSGGSLGFGSGGSDGFPSFGSGSSGGSPGLGFGSGSSGGTTGSGSGNSGGSGGSFGFGSGSSGGTTGSGSGSSGGGSGFGGSGGSSISGVSGTSSGESGLSTPSSFPDGSVTSSPGSGLSPIAPTIPTTASFPTSPKPPSSTPCYGKPSFADEKWNFGPDDVYKVPELFIPPKDWSKPNSFESTTKVNLGTAVTTPYHPVLDYPHLDYPGDFGSLNHHLFPDGSRLKPPLNTLDINRNRSYVQPSGSDFPTSTKPKKSHLNVYRGDVKFGGVRKSPQGSGQRIRDDGYFRIPTGVAVRAHVQSLDIVPYDKRFVSPGEALKRYTSHAGH